MAKKKAAKTHQSAVLERDIPLIWDIPPDMVTGYATNILVQVGERELFISFFETVPPLILDRTDVDKLESVRAECIARIVVLPERLEAFIKVLQRQLDAFRENQKKAAESNESK